MVKTQRKSNTNNNRLGSKRGPESPESRANRCAAAILRRRPESVTSEDVEKVLNVLFDKPRRQNRYQSNPQGFKDVIGGTIGLSTGYAGETFCFSWKNTKRVACLMNRFRDLRRGISEDVADAVRPTTIQVNVNTAKRPGVDLHVDGNNLGPSDIIALGDYEGGQLFVESAPKQRGSCDRELLSETGCSTSAPTRTRGTYRGKLHNIKDRFQQFNGSTQLHAAEPTVAGKRFSLVWYSVNARFIEKLTSQQLRELVSCGFRPRSMDEVSGMPRPPVQKNDSRCYDAVYLTFARTFRAEVERRLVEDEDVQSLADASRLLEIAWKRLPADRRRSFNEAEECRRVYGGSLDWLPFMFDCAYEDIFPASVWREFHGLG